MTNYIVYLPYWNIHKCSVFVSSLSILSDSNVANFFPFFFITLQNPYLPIVYSSFFSFKEKTCIQNGSGGPDFWLQRKACFSLSH